VPEELSREEARERLRRALEAHDAEGTIALAEEHPRSIAEAAYELSSTELAYLLLVLGDERLARVVATLDASETADVLLRMSRAQAADVLEEMAPDDAADVVGELEGSEAESILVEMEPAEAEDVRELLAYPPDTAGGLMTPEFLIVSPDLTADQAIERVRDFVEEDRSAYHVYVTDAEEHLLGVLPLHSLVLSGRQMLVRDLMIPREDTVAVAVDMNQEDVARLFGERRLLALPVVDGSDRLLGLITADDVADVVEEEASEDIALMGATSPLEQPYLRTSILEMVRKRIGWLLLLFVAETLTGSVLRFFEDELARVVALSFFIPLLIGTGGNAGSQTVTTIVRALALREIRFRDAGRVFMREAGSGVILGLLLGVIGFGRALLWGTHLPLALVVGLTLLAICAWANTIGSLVPLVAERLGIDPTVMSAPLITTLVDASGLFIYFTIAKILLGL
jgi:magnesium transporter